MPIRIEIGPRDLEKNSVMLTRRDQGVKDKQAVDIDSLASIVPDTLQHIQDNLLQRAQQRLADNSVTVTTKEDFVAAFSNNENTSPFVTCYAADNAEVEKVLKPLKVSARCIPLEQEDTDGTCIFTGESVQRKIVFAKAY